MKVILSISPFLGRIATNVVDKKKAKNSPVDQVKVKELKLSINVSIV